MTRHRSSQTWFESDALVQGLTKYAKLKRTPWRWCGDDYPKPIWSLGPDRRALANNAPVLLELARDRGETLLVATHSHEVADAADRILRIDDHALIDISKDDL